MLLFLFSRPPCKVPASWRLFFLSLQTLENLLQSATFSNPSIHLLAPPAFLCAISHLCCYSCMSALKSQLITRLNWMCVCVCALPCVCFIFFCSLATSKLRNGLRCDCKTRRIPWVTGCGSNWTLTSLHRRPRKPKKPKKLLILAPPPAAFRNSLPLFSCLKLCFCHFKATGKEDTKYGSFFYWGDICVEKTKMGVCEKTLSCKKKEWFEIWNRARSGWVSGWKFLVPITDF